ncbi:hypothetical protein ACFSTC_48075 [Nonomuraea ferruginea]
MTTAREALSDPDLRGAFRWFYVWRDPDGTWHARPLPKLTSEEIAYRILPELVADSPHPARLQVHVAAKPPQGLPLPAEVRQEERHP